MSSKKLHFVAEKNTSVISDLSPEGEARALQLADVALQTTESQGSPISAGSRAVAEHRLLIEELQREAENGPSPKRVA